MLMDLIELDKLYRLL